VGTERHLCYRPSVMDCRSFRQSHVAYIDDTLPGVDQRAMAEHARTCSACAVLDARVRRSLMAARSLDPITPSQDFSTRLRSRLDAERRRMTVAPPLARGPSLAAFFATAAAVVGVGVLAVEMQMRDESSVAPPTLAGVTATVPAAADTLYPSSSALAAAMSTTAPIWSLAYVADHVPIRFATVHLVEEQRDR
jgi:hypothetical protein